MRRIRFFIGIIIIAGLMFSCGEKENPGTDEVPELPGHIKQVPHEFLDDKKDITFSEAFKEAPAETVTFHDLRNYNPEKLRNLNDRKVAINGFAIPVGPPDMSYFVITKIPFNDCYFCLTPDTSEQVIVYTAEPPEFNLLQSPIRVTGRLDAGIKEDINGFITLYRLDACLIEPITEDVLPPETRAELKVIEEQYARILELQRTLLGTTSAAGNDTGK